VTVKAAPHSSPNPRLSDKKYFLGAIFGKKPDYSGGFQRPNLMLRDILGWDFFHRH
jgi:hypothetical protein